MRNTLLRWLLAALPLAIAVPLPVQAQAPAGAEAPAQAAALSKEQLDQLLAPIALYPDGVLVQVLMAATYPLEVVEAARWVKANPDIKGDAAVKAVENKGWDVSVQSLVAFPQAITMMSDQLEWTQDLGNAVLAQQKDVLDSVQRLRAMAQKAGTLESNEQQKVTVQPAAAGTTTQTIIIEPAQPQTIYVPAYNPTVVYGTWPYPAYAPYYYPPNPYYYPGGALARGFAWGVGLAAAGAVFGGANWGRGDIDIDVNRATNINRNFNASSARAGSWQHNSSHRKGVAYKDSASRQKYGRSDGAAASRDQFRGRESERGSGDRGGDRAGDRGGDRAGDRGGDRGGDRAQSGDRGGDRGQAGDRGGDRGGDRAQAADRGGSRGGQDFGSRDAGSRGQSSSARAQPAGLDGMGSRGSDVSAQANRGQSSRQASQSSFGGGGSHAGGGGGGGGARASGGGGGGARGGGGGGRGGGGGGRR